MIELLCHLLGDYTFQTSWMALEKSRNSLAAAVHAGVYTAVFLLLLTPSWPAITVIGLTHFVIDRWSLAKLWTGLLGQRGLPEVLGVWLLIINDNIFHLAINYFALHKMA